VVAERIEIEELQAGPDITEGSSANTQLITYVKEEILHLPLSDLIGLDHVRRGHLPNTAYIFTSSTSDQSGELQVSDHAFSEFRHRGTLSHTESQNPGHTGRQLERTRPELWRA
jgi:hypothetical protein